jgi:hypothetical protein
VGDDRAEHVPGCNMAFRRDGLLAIGGFDPIYTSAGDDVDVCWKLLERGESIGFSPAAQVRHHRRATVKGYLRQQRGYGRAEKLLSGAHPERFNRLGQARWSGFIYGGVGLLPRVLRPVVYHGDLGLAPFQPISRRPTDAATAWGTALLPFAAPLVAITALLGLVEPWAWVLAALLVLSVPAFGLAVAGSVRPDRGEPTPWRLRALVGWLHLAQPFYRTWGRLRAGRPECRVETPVWTGDRVRWLDELRMAFHAAGLGVRYGGPHDAWDCVGVAWKWVPHVRTRVRPTAAFYALVALAVLALAARPVTGVVLSVALVGMVVVETLLLSHRVRRACGHTTTEAMA